VLNEQKNTAWGRYFLGKKDHYGLTIFWLLSATRKSEIYGLQKVVLYSHIILNKIHHSLECIDTLSLSEFFVASTKAAFLNLLSAVTRP
jgi:hypothetical protein